MRNLELAVFALLLTGPTVADTQEGLRDPTRPYNATPVASTSSGGGKSNVSRYDVTAIFTSDSRRVAIVNGKRVVEGDKIDGATVVEITANTMSLEVSGKVVERRVLPPGLRK